MTNADGNIDSNTQPATMRTANSLSLANPAMRGWLFAVSVYFVAVLNRSSLSVAGLMAQQRFGISPGQLSSFLMLQLGVYAAMQIPAGVLVDRYGPRRLLVSAAALMTVSQALFALAPSYPLALLARTVLGCGDALTFISVLRLVAGHFSVRRYPVLAGLTGTVGQAGNVVATLPLAMALHSVGWVPVYLGAAVFAALAGLGAQLLVPDSTPTPARIRSVAHVRGGIGSVSQRVRGVWGSPGTRTAFWLHFTPGVIGSSLGMLWGDPYLVKAGGFSESASGAILMSGVIVGAVAGPVLGAIVGGQPRARTPIGIGCAALLITGWLVAFSLGEHPPRLLLVVLFLIQPLGGMTGMFALAVARDYTDARVLGTTSGTVNCAGFIATIIAVTAMGWVLDGLGGTTAHALRWSLLAAMGVQGFGLFRLSIWYRRLRAYVLAQQAAGHPVPVPVRRARWDLAGD